MALAAGEGDTPLCGLGEVVGVLEGPPSVWALQPAPGVTSAMGAEVADGSDWCPSVAGDSTVTGDGEAEPGGGAEMCPCR